MTSNKDEWPPQAHLKIMHADAKQLQWELDDAILAANRGDDMRYYRGVLNRRVKKLEESVGRL